MKPWIGEARRDKQMVTLVATCVLCGESTTYLVGVENLERWQAGEHIQNVWPEFSPAQRELLISGTCGSCFDELFKEEED